VFFAEDVANVIIVLCVLLLSLLLLLIFLLLPDLILERVTVLPFDLLQVVHGVVKDPEFVL